MTGTIVRRLRARQTEIEHSIFARVRELVPAPGGDAQYLEGLRAAVVGAVEYSFLGLEGGEGFSVEIPAQAVAQARRAARSGVSLDAVLRRYIVGNALMCDYVMQECDALELRGRVSGRELLRTQSMQLDRLVIGVTREHVAELQRAGRSREQRQLERVRMLLAGEDTDAAAAAGGEHDPDLDYDLGGEHLGVIAHGTGAEQALRELAAQLDRRLLSVTPDERTVWAWLGGRRALEMLTVRRAVDGGASDEGLTIAAGEPARGLDGWRLSHQQAQAALLVATRGPRVFTRYGDVALLATALKDESLGRALLDVYLVPLEDERGGGAVLRETLQAYLAAGRNASSAAVALKIARSTCAARLQTIEERLGRTLSSCPAELEVASRLHELGLLADPENSYGERQAQ